MNSKLIKYPLIFALSAVSLSVLAQKRTVVGAIYSLNSSEPIEGAIITVKGTEFTTKADSAGLFLLDSLPKRGKVIFSAEGYDDLSVKYRKSTFMQVLLCQDDYDMWDEEVNVGWGQVTKKEITSSVSSVDGDQLVYGRSTDLADLVQGMVPGLSVLSAPPVPGEASQIQIRGLGSIMGESTPLYVIDDVPQDGVPSINSSEIASVEVLKDAASCSIYGTRGANGVILITTKRAFDN